MPDVFEMLTDRQRAVWSAGEWTAVSPIIANVSEVVVERLGVESGHDLLDVGTGDGTAAILGARRGARTTGLDFLPHLIEAAERRGEAEGVEATWVVGDAQDLPFDDDSFDRVSSVMGAMFAPDQERAASELVRVCRPGGRIAVTGWTPEGLNGRMFMTIGKHMPPPPEGFRSPILWGTEARVRELFAGHEVTTEKCMLPFDHDSFDEFFAFFEKVLGPLVMARAVLEPEGKWEAARDDVKAVYASGNERSDGGIRTQTEYLLTTVTPS